MTRNRNRVIRSAVAQTAITLAVLTVVLTPGCGTLSTLVSSPAFSPGSSIFFGSLYVTITSSTSGAEIHYTTDGSTPSQTHGVPYGGPIRIERSTTVKAIAYHSDMADSTVSSAAFTQVGHSLGVWGSSASNVWLVGGYYDRTTYEPLASRYDGTGWTPTTLPDGADIPMAVWGSADNDVFAVGLQGTILHWDGNAWSTMTSGTTEELRGVWGSAWNDVFAVGAGGTILHYNGASWSAMVSGTTEDLLGVWGVAFNAVLAVGKNGMIRGYDGNTWGLSASGVTEDLWEVWGTSATNAFAVGDNGTILRWNGGGWTPMTSGTTQDLRSIWGIGSEAFAVGASGTILYFNGGAWAAMTSGTMSSLQCIWGNASDNILAVGTCGTVLRFNGTTWSKPWGDDETCAGF